MLEDAQGAPASPADASPARSLTVLVADDEPIIRMLVSRVLTSGGHRVHAVESAHEACRLLDDHHFDGAFVDDNMPGQGRSVLQSLRTREDFRGFMVLMSGYPPEEEDAMDPDVLHLTKPFRVHQVADIVERHAP